MQGRLQGIKYCTKRKCHLVGTFLKKVVVVVVVHSSLAGVL
jgi:hypothetical protein